ncbi:hypothetical protein TNCV_5100831 [Trichonephila clavipes]|uniref:Reverse transcriptase n=1 Tax=Trichonephila clavipes TaxID=2585209 RepID=A0A8X6V7I8_TRICX|nr:hypothetical protein TNCV_5100831 [Trichonephila clavipes]
MILQPDGRGYELVSSVRALVPQKFSVEEELMHVKHVDVKSPHVGVMWKFGRGVISSDQQGLTHVLYHEIDTEDQGQVVSRPYHYDRVKQGIIDYHIEKMLQEGKIRSIQSPYASPVVLTLKNNGLPPDSPEAY